MIIETLTPQAIITLCRRNSPFEITYDDLNLRQIKWFQTTDKVHCRIIAPIEFTLQGVYEDDLNRKGTYDHENSHGFITVTWKYAAICFQDPDEMLTYTVLNPIELKRR